MYKVDRRTLVCSFGDLDMIKKTLPNRNVQAFMAVPDGRIYWCGHKGIMRSFIFNDPTQWVCQSRVDIEKHKVRQKVFKRKK